ncbi:E3 ubiquitin-protein ligase TRIM21-like [Scomber scombrus]|uniref:E3 ubiquitin-protein ligase TRIM21-like n=1 Tax=Scomber scombrus TaxID=13677 RepID=UPI002DDB7746|nr:E3 ubiquitin-protein ligase TRIM21-like [Scomber scombrus]
MAAASCLLTEDQFLCSICLDVFTDPVTTPCGHNFCKNCITEHWSSTVQCRCPICKRLYKTKPELQVNTFISEMAAQFRQSAQQKAIFDHKTHDVVPLKEEYEGKKAELGKTGAEVQQMIQKRQLKIQEIKRSVRLSKEDAVREIAEGLQVFTELKASIERSQAELVKTIKEKQRKTERQAEDFMKELEEEIFQLKKARSESAKNWAEVRVQPTSYEGSVARAVAHLEEMITQPMKKLFEAELKRVKRYEVQVTLDPDIVHPKPAQSNDKQQVKQGNECRCVLSKQGFSSGRFYFQVQVNRWSSWTLGVVRNSANMNRETTLSPRNGYWTVCFKWSKGYFADGAPSGLNLKKKPAKMGVFVDYEQGVVSFYDVDAAGLIYSFTGCSFTDKLHPFYSPCSNDGVKIHITEKDCVLL